MPPPRRHGIPTWPHPYPIRAGPLRADLPPSGFRSRWTHIPQPVCCRTSASRGRDVMGALSPRSLSLPRPSSPLPSDTNPGSGSIWARCSIGAGIGTFSQRVVCASLMLRWWCGVVTRLLEQGGPAAVPTLPSRPRRPPPRLAGGSTAKELQENDRGPHSPLAPR